MSILIVDDNAMNAKIIEYNLQRHEYQTITATSASEALTCLETMPEIQLVISDIMMPEIDGLELLKRINQHKEWRNIPVIMCTALSDAETVQKAAIAGCRHYIIKPIKAVQLIQKVRETLCDKGVNLKNKSKIISELGIDQNIYDEILSTFTGLVENTIKVIEESPQGESVVEDSVALMNLLESASLLGAEKVANVLNTMLSKPENGFDHSLLLRELKVLFKMLTQENDKASSTVKEKSTDIKS